MASRISSTSAPAPAPAPSEAVKTSSTSMVASEKSSVLAALPAPTSKAAIVHQPIHTGYFIHFFNTVSEAIKHGFVSCTRSRVEKNQRISQAQTQYEQCQRVCNELKQAAEEIGERRKHFEIDMKEYEKYRFVDNDDFQKDLFKKSIESMHLMIEENFAINKSQVADEILKAAIIVCNTAKAGGSKFQIALANLTTARSTLEELELKRSEALERLKLEKIKIS